MLIPLLFVPQANVDAALDRYANFMNRWTTVSVDMRVRTNLVASEGNGNIVLKKPNLAHFTMAWNGTQYSYSQNTTRIVEMDRATKLYRDYISFPGWATPPGDVSRIPQFGFPNMLLNVDLRKVGGLGNFKLIKTSPGIRASTFSAKLQVPGGAIDYEFKIDEFGRPLHIRSSATPVTGRVVTDQYFSNWIYDRQVPQSTFSGRVPSGYRAQAMPMDPFPIGVSERFPTNVWTRCGQRNVDPDSDYFVGKRFLAAIVDTNCAPSTRLIQFLQSNKSAFNVRQAVLWNSTQGSVQGLNSFFNPNLSAARTCHLAGTPAIYLVDSRGIVEKLWYGFDPARQPTLKNEIITAIKGD